MQNIVLVGLGPHAKRIYLNFLKKYQLSLTLLIELESNRDYTYKYLKANHFPETKTFFVPDKEANFEELSFKTSSDLSSLITKYSLKYAIISTEPKAHFAYAKFFLEHDINILMDKPITLPVDFANNSVIVPKILEQYNYLSNLYKLKKDYVTFSVLCQRRFHVGYIYIKKLLTEVITKYQIPITYLDIYHSDGMWNMPNEFFSRENHPYKYGYGKLFHSGYHFVDLLAWLLECNESFEKNKINKCQIVTSSFKPSDFFATVNNDFYQKFLGKDYEEILNNPQKVENFGELDFYANLDFFHNNQKITHASISMLQSGFSKRAWTELPDDTYKANGRVRHERLNIQVGPLLNIQVHSYQSHEINKDSNIKEYEVGSLDHFDIYIFRNTALIGGQEFEKISIKDLEPLKEDNYLGNNEKAREICFKEFMNDQKGESDLLKHSQSILLLSKLLEAKEKENHPLEFLWRDYE